MKKLFLAAILLIGLTLTSFAQSSAAFKYQAVARNASQEVYANQTLALRFSIILDAGSGSGDGTVVYSESHQNTETSPLGVFALNIGQGQVLSGDWEDIDWQNGYYFLKVDMDVDNGTNYSNVGKSPLLSVPFALHAATVTDKDDADADPNNELQSITLNGTEISLSNGNTVDLAPIIQPGGTDDQELTLNGNILQIEGGNSIDLSALAGNGGTDDQELTLNGTVLQIEGGNSIDLAPLQDGVNDADADPNNELQSITLNGTEISLSNGNTVDLASIIPPGGTDDQELTLNGSILQIEGGNSIDLAPLQDGVNDADADPNNEIQNLTLNGTEISLSNGNTVDLASIIPPGGTDDQELTLNGNILQIEGGNSIDLSALAGIGGTDDQELTLNGSILQIEGGNSIDLAPLQDGVNDADADPNNELQSITLNGTEISLSNGNTVDLASIIPPGGTDDQELTLNGTVLQIEGGNDIDLAPLQDGVNDADADPSNELQNLTLNGTNLEIENGNTVDLFLLQDGVIDADSDPFNEIQSLILNGNTLTIENGNNVDLSTLTSSEIWTQDAQNIYYDAGRVGIGTDNPNYALHIENTFLASDIYLNGSENGRAQQRMGIYDNIFSSADFLIDARNEGDTAAVFALTYRNFNPLANFAIDFLEYNTDRLFPTHLGTQTAISNTIDIRGESGTGFQDRPRLQFTYDNNMPDGRQFIEQSVSTFGDSVSMNWTQNAREYGPLPLSGQVQLMRLTTHPLFGNELEVTGNIRGLNGRFTEAGGAIIEDVVAVTANEAPFAIHADHAGSAPGTFVAGFHGSAQAGGLELSADSGTALKVESFGSGAAMTATGGNVGIGSTDPGALLTVGSNPSRFFLGPATTIGGSDALGAALFVGNDDEAVVIERNLENMMSISSESADAGTFTQEPLLIKTGNLHVGINDEPDNLFMMSVHQQAYGLSLHNNLTDAEWEIFHGGSLQFYYDGQYRGEISSADGVYTPSDRKFKDQIRSIGTVLPALMQLKVNRYRYIHGNETNKQSLGLIAQEVQEIFPELVKEVKREGFESNLTMNYSGFGVIAVKAIQEQQQTIDQQEERIEDLEARLLHLEKLLKE